MKTPSAFYSWAAAEGHAGAMPFSYSPQVITRPDGARVEITRNLATVRTEKALHQEVPGAAVRGVDDERVGPERPGG